MGRLPMCYLLVRLLLLLFTLNTGCHHDKCVGQGPPENSHSKGWQEKKVALTLMTFFCLEEGPPLVHAHSACCLSQLVVVVVFSTFITSSTALGELESIPGVLKRQWGYTWTSLQFISGPHRKTNNHSHFYFGLCEVAGKNPHRHSENIQTAHRETPDMGLEPTAFLATVWITAPFSQVAFVPFAAKQTYSP